jgi:Do/DeqQ family serine protease
MNRIRNLTLSLIVSAGLLGSGAIAFAKDSSALEMAKQLNEAFVEVADKVSPSVVVITVTEKSNYHGNMYEDNGDDSSSPWDMLPPDLRRYFEDWGKRGNRGNQRRQQRVPQMQGEGSGIIITKDGYILTNNHVVEGADKIKVRFKNGDVYEATVKGTDAESDIAVIKINAKNLIPAKLGDSDATRVGEFAIAIGAPFQLSYSVTVGHVSAKGRTVGAMTPNGYADQDFIQTDASINPGNSGGPLVNLYGEVIGINAMIRGMNTGIGFAIPINLAKRVSDHLISEGKFVRSWIGVGIMDLKDEAELRDLDPTLRPDVAEGVFIRTVQPDAPAAGKLKPGDVVVAVDGKSVKTPRQLQEIVSGTKPGQTISLEVVRNHNQHVTVKIKTEALPGDLAKAGRSRGQGGSDSADESTNFGLSVDNLNKDLASKYDVDPNQQGVVVTAVESGSLAEDSGIKVGDIITDVNMKPVTSRREFREALSNADPKRGARFNVISNGVAKFLVLRDRD